jgi:hypothetical protein
MHYSNPYVTGGQKHTHTDNMKLFTKQQIEGALKACDMYKTLGYPLNADVEAVLQVGGIGGCTITFDFAKVAHKIWGASVPRLKSSTVRETGHRKPQSLCVCVSWPPVTRGVTVTRAIPIANDPPQ